MAFLTGYRYRVPITVTNGYASTFTDLPLLVDFSESTGFAFTLLSELAISSGATYSLGIAFTEADGTTLIPFELNRSPTIVAALAKTFTASSATDKLTLPAGGPWYDVGEVVQVSVSGGSLPGGLSANTFYWIVSVSGDDYQLSSVKGGAPVDLTTNGSGTMTITDYRLVFAAWIKPASLPNGTTAIYLNFAKPAADASSGYNQTSVWNSNYQAVIHGEQTPTGAAGDILDSTSGARNGTSAGSMGALVSGEVDRALNFDSSNDAVTIAHDTALDPASLSVSVFFKPNAAATFYHTICGKTDSSWGGGWGLVRHIESGGEVEFFINGYGHGASASDSTNLPTGTWASLVGTYDGTTIRLYANGVQIASHAYSTALTGTTNDVTLGKLGGLSALDGAIDEVRISAVVLSPDEIAFTYTNITSNSSTISFGSVQTSDQVNFDAAASSGYVTSASSTTFAVTCLGENRFVEYTIGILAAGVSVSSVVRNSQTATAIDSKATVTTLGTQYTFGQIAPTAGTYNVTVTLSGSAAAFGAAAVSFTGVDQTVPTESNANAQATNVGAADAVVAVTTATNADWICYGVISDDGSVIAYTGCTSRANIAGAVGTAFAGTYGPKATAGSQTVGCTNVGALATWAICGNAVRPKSAESAGGVASIGTLLLLGCGA